jgi:hypothetical protein
MDFFSNYRIRITGNRCEVLEQDGYLFLLICFPYGKNVCWKNAWNILCAYIARQGIHINRINAKNTNKSP